MERTHCNIKKYFKQLEVMYHVQGNDDEDVTVEVSLETMQT